MSSLSVTVAVAGLAPDRAADARRIGAVRAPVLVGGSPDEQVLVVIQRHQPLVVDSERAVAQSESGGPVRDPQDGAVRPHRLQAFEHALLCSLVQLARSLVDDDDLAAVKDCACEGESLTLAAGQFRSGFADPEQIVRADPDAVLLVDMLGAGRDSFTPLLSNPGVSELAAVRDDRVLVLDGKQAQALGLVTATEGAQRIRDWLAGLDRS